MWTKREGIMLAYPFEEKRLAKWKPPYIVQPKLDGERCRAEIDRDGNIKLVSSELHQFNLLPHIEESIRRLGIRNIELDGELYRANTDFSIIHSIASRRTTPHEEYETLQFHVFDYVSSEAQIERIDKLLDLPTDHNVQLVPTYPADNLEEVMSFLQEFYADGYEGIIVRELSAPYVRKRSTMMMKWKPGGSDIYEIVGTKEEIDQYGSPKNALGAIICKGMDEETFSVGTGYTRSDRQYLWEIRHNLPGKFLRVDYQNLTHKRGVPRNPVYNCLITETPTKEEMDGLF